MIQMEASCPLFQVFDMPTSLAFYRDGLGFEVIQSEPQGEDCDWCWLRRNQAQLMLNTRYEKEHRPDQPDPQHHRIHRDVGLYIACKDLDGAYAALQERGMSAEPPQMANYGAREITLRDPDGYGVCLYAADE